MAKNKDCRKNKFFDIKVPNGILNDLGIISAIDEGSIYISPFNKKQVTGVGYNLLLSRFLVSHKTGLPLRIHENGSEIYVEIKPFDTVLALTRESIFVNNTVVGTFHSRVKIVSQGFGHISTTLDPSWEGPLLIALNNPSNKTKKLILEDEKGPTSFVTVVLYKQAYKTDLQHDNPHHRIDVLKSYLKTPQGLKKVFLGKSFHQYKSIVDLLDAPPQIEHSNVLFENINSFEILLNELQKILSRADKNNTELTYQNLIVLINQYKSKSPQSTLLNMLIVLKGELEKSFINFNDKNINKLKSYIEAVQEILEKEKRVIVWDEAYKKCVALSQNNTFINWKMRFIISSDFSVYIKNTLLILILAIIFWLIFFTPFQTLSLGSINEILVTDIINTVTNGFNDFIKTLIVTTLSGLIIKLISK